jgi:hypothetical protein
MTEQRRYLVAACVVPFAVDVTCTLWGQSADYWQGNRAIVNESTWVGFRLLQAHPLIFAAASMLYAIGFSLLIRFLPRPLALWLSFGFFVAHTSGVNSWLGYHAIGEPLHNALAAGWGAYCYSHYFRSRGFP